MEFVAQRSASSTRQRLLDAGRELLSERGIDLGLRNLPVTDVAERAGHTTGAVYQIWKRQEDFHRDLALYAVAEQDRPDTAVVRDAIRSVRDAGGAQAEILRTGADAYLDYLTESGTFHNNAHFVAVSQNDPAVRTAVKAGYDRVHVDFRDLVGGLLDLFELELREPFTLDDATVMLTAIAEGFALRRAIDPESCRQDLTYESALSPTGQSGDGWSLLACAVDAVLHSITQPRS